MERLAAKLRAYTDLAAATGITTPTLIWLSAPRGEAHLHHALTPSAAADPRSHRQPREPSRRYLAHDRRRVYLTHLM